jgi:hypothetical protein
MNAPQQIAPQAAAPRGFSRTRLSFGLLGAPIAWLAQYALSYPLAARACAGRPRLGPLDIQGAEILVAVAAILLAGVAAWAGYVALGTWRAARHDETSSVLHSDADDRAAFMGMGGVILSAVFFVGILWNVVTPFVASCSEVL